MSRTGTSIETESGLVIARGSVKGEMESGCSWAQDFFLDGNVLELFVVMTAQHCEYTTNQCTVHFKKQT